MGWHVDIVIFGEDRWCNDGICRVPAFYPFVCYPAALTIVMNNLRIKSFYCLCDPSFDGVDGGQRMRTEMLLVRGIDCWFFVDRSEDEWFCRDVPERQQTLVFG